VIREARRVSPSMLALGLALLFGFVAIAIATIVSVGGSRSDSPELDDLALPVGVDLVDSHATCDATACDGFGLVVDRDGADLALMVETIADRLRMDDWVDRTVCEGPVTCLARGDLRVEIRSWIDLDETVAPTMRASLDEASIDQSRLVYVSYYRCGVLRPCA